MERLPEEVAEAIKVIAGYIGKEYGERDRYARFILFDDGSGRVEEGLSADARPYQMWDTNQVVTFD